jgi:hypothetical protein
VKHVQSDAETLYAQIEPWVVLAASTLITACYTRNFSTIQLLKVPIRAAGTIKDSIGTIDLPHWFPAGEGVLEVAGGAIYAKLKELPLPMGSQKIGENGIRLQFDAKRVPLPAGALSFTLTYFPWFRFLSEPIGFDAVDRVAAHIAGCFRFMFAQHGISAAIEGDGDRRVVRSDAGLAVEIAGMSALKSLALTDGDKRTAFDLVAHEIAIDRRMFPAAYEAGAQMLKSADRLVNVDARTTDTHLHLGLVKGVANV